MAGSSSEIERVEETESVDNETLMNCIQNYRCLYDKGCKDYKVPLKKRNAWKEISAKLGIPVEEATKRYNNIRTVFSKYIKRMTSTRSGSGRNDVPELRKDMEHLRWLIVHIKHRRGTTNLKRRKTDESSTVGSEAGDENTVGSNEESEEAIDQHDQISLDGHESFEHSIRTADGESREEDSPISINDSNSVASLEDGSNSASGSSQHLPQDASHKPKPKAKKAAKKFFSSTPMSKKRSWTKDQKPTTVDDMDREFLRTMNSIQKAITDSEVVTKPRMSEEDDDDRHYCLSLVGQLKALEPQFKTMAKMQVMKVFNDIAWMRATQQQQLFSGNDSRYSHGQPHLHIPNTSTYTQYQGQLYQPPPQVPLHTTSANYQVEHRGFVHELVSQDEVNPAELPLQ